MKKHGNRWGMKNSEEHRQKIREAHLGRKKPEHSERLSGDKHFRAKGCYIIINNSLYEFGNVTEMADVINKRFGYSKRGLQSNWITRGIPNKYSGEINKIGLYGA